MIIFPLPLADGDVLRIHLVPFLGRGFDPSAFAATGIERPHSIARSVIKRQAEFFFGRLAARKALQDFGAPTTEVLVGSDREPIWPCGTVGSISHIDGLAGAVVGPKARYCGLGIDLERVAHGQAQVALRESVVDSEELSRLGAIGGILTLDQLVTLVFSAKESLYKTAYGTVGHFFGFEAARVQTVDEDQCIVVLTLTDHLHPNFPRGRDCVISFARLDSETFLTAMGVLAKDTFT
jgi:enterobactin synthetase component D